MHRNIKLEATPSVKTCVSMILKESTRRRQASSSGQLVATGDPSSEQKVHLHPNLDGEKYIRKFDDPAQKKSSRRVGRSTNFTIKYWTGPVQDLVKIPPILKPLRATLRFVAYVRATAYGLHLGLQTITKTSKGWR